MPSEFNPLPCVRIAGGANLCDARRFGVCRWFLGAVLNGFFTL